MPLIWEHVDDLFGNMLGISQTEPNQLEDVFFIFCWLLGSSNPRARKKHVSCEEIEGEHLWTWEDFCWFEVFGLFHHPGTMMGVKLQPEVVEDPEDP